MDFIRKIAKVLVVALVVWILFIMAYATYETVTEDVVKQTPVETQVEKQNEINRDNRHDTLGQETKDTFIEYCLEEGLSLTFCNCSMDYLDSKLTNEEFWFFVGSIDTPEADALLDEVVEYCDSWGSENI